MSRQSCQQVLERRVRFTARPAEQLEAAAPRRQAADPRRLSGSDRDRAAASFGAPGLGVHQPGRARNNSGGRARTGTRLSAARLRGSRRGRSRPRPAGRRQRQRGGRRARVRSPALRKRTGSASGPRSPCPPGSGPEPAPGPGTDQRNPRTGELVCQPAVSAR